jgi:hypothetical protein
VKTVKVTVVDTRTVWLRRIAAPRPVRKEVRGSIASEPKAASTSKAASPTREHSPPEGEEGEREAGEVRPSGISRIDVAAKVRGSVSRSDRNGSGRLVRDLNGRREG